MLGETRASFFHQITGEEESGRKSFSSSEVGIVVQCVTRVGKL